MPDFYRFLGEADLHSRAFRRPLSSPLLSFTATSSPAAARWWRGPCHSLPAATTSAARRGAGGHESSHYYPFVVFSRFFDEAAAARGHLFPTFPCALLSTVEVSATACMHCTATTSCRPTAPMTQMPSMPSRGSRSGGSRARNCLGNIASLSFPARIHMGNNAKKAGFM